MAISSVFNEHGRALVLIARNPDMPMRDMADTLGLSERRTQRIVADLVGAGLVTRQRVGRRATLGMDAELRDAVLIVHGFDGGATIDANRSQSKREGIVTRLLMAVDGILGNDESFAALSVERLIKAAGISRSTFYANFQDKDDLLIALVNRVIEELWVAARMWTELGSDLTKDDIAAAMHKIGDARHPHRAVMTAASQSDATRVKLHYCTLMTRSADMVSEHIRRGQAQGFVRKGIDPAATALLLTWGTEHRLNKLAVTDRDDVRVQQVLGSLADIIWNLLYAGVRR